MSALVKIAVTVGGIVTIGFGVWHFFVPAAWNWYVYIDPAATELVVAVRAINFFFSLSLVLFGAMTLLLALPARSGRYAAVVVLGAASVLWLARVAMQIVHPQGSMNPAIQYGMLAAFVFIFLCHAVPLVLMLADRGHD